MLTSAGKPRVHFLAAVELLKPITWFPPMWAFACGAVSAGVPVAGNGWKIVLGILLAGPLVCAASQAINDWFDRHVDAINEPHRPIPSGRLPGNSAVVIAWLWSLLSLAVASLLGPVVFAATIVGLALAYAYSAPPLRLKRNGWWGNAACGLSYEGLAWVTGAALMLGRLPDWPILLLALLYSIGAHGIMTLNDFKSIQGDKRSGIRSLPVQQGAYRAAVTACWFMLVPQIGVVALLLSQVKPVHAGIVVVLVLAQCAAMLRLIEDPLRRATWYSAVGVTFFVSGMMVSALAVS
jgi:chlorophyll synthase